MSGSDLANTNVGNIGIGTGSPAARLDVAHAAYGLRTSNDGGEPGLQIENTEPGGRRYDLFVGSTNSFDAGTSHVGHLFIADHSVTAQPRVAIDTNGRFGIGTASPQGALSVAGGAQLGMLPSGIDPSANQGLSIAGPGNAFVLWRRDLTAYPTVPVAGDLFQFYAPSNAQMSIWTPTTGDLISVTNKGDMQVNGTLHVNGDVYARGTLLSSDGRLKEHVRTITSALDAVARLRGVRFDWKKTGEPSIGVIAQEVEQIFPEIVSSNAGVKSVDYPKLEAVLIEAVKELHARNRDLQHRIEALESRATGGP